MAVAIAASRQVCRKCIYTIAALALRLHPGNSDRPPSPKSAVRVAVLAVLRGSGVGVAAHDAFPVLRTVLARKEGGGDILTQMGWRCLPMNSPG
eukprot:7039869-Pyramimonas_sp.AAC.1